MIQGRNSGDTSCVLKNSNFEDWFHAFIVRRLLEPPYRMCRVAAHANDSAKDTSSGCLAIYVFWSL